MISGRFTVHAATSLQAEIAAEKILGELNPGRSYTYSLHGHPYSKGTTMDGQVFMTEWDVTWNLKR